MKQICNHCENQFDKKPDKGIYQLYNCNEREKNRILLREYRLCKNCSEIFEEFNISFRKNNK